MKRKPETPLVPELSSSLVFGEAVPIPTLPFALIRNASNHPIHPFCTVKSGRVEIGQSDVFVIRSCIAGSTPVSEMTDEPMINLIFPLGVAVSMGRKLPPPPFTSPNHAPLNLLSENKNIFEFVQKSPMAP